MVKLRDNKAEADAGDQGERLASLDAARGVLLLLLISSGFGLRQVLTQEHWKWLTDQWTHRTWEGCTLWDLLQPAFLFCVGVAMPYSYANRQGRGQNWIRQFAHALKRAVLLIAIGMYLDAYRDNRPLWEQPLAWLEFRGDLQMIGLSYLLAFLVLPLGSSVQGVTVAFLLVGHTAGHVIYAFASGQGEQLWSQGHNLGVAIDHAMHLAPHKEHYTTFNVLACTAIILLGMLIANLIRSSLSSGTQVAIMTACSLAALLLGWLLSGGIGIVIIPMIKRLVTWTFVLTAVGWTLLVFTYFYLLLDSFSMRSWALPLTVLGRNSLFLFVAFALFRDWPAKTALLMLPASPATPRPLFVELIVLAIFWLICTWLYRRRIFFNV
ncbi:MAG: DUF5009 domain-containing protein [Planctomycetes bacterium]|nr:DUF5009 domain-containing protein [Planctomycetota bacterium]